MTDFSEIILKHYQKEGKLLGEGAFGRVFGFDIDQRTNPGDGFPKRIAVKEVGPYNAFDQLKRTREYTNLSQLKHCNIVQLLGWAIIPKSKAYFDKNKGVLVLGKFDEADAGEDPSSESCMAYIVMEQCHGSLKQVLGKGKVFMEGEVAIVVRQIALALEYIHDMGIMHRDVKPDNILLYLALPPSLESNDESNHTAIEQYIRSEAPITAFTFKLGDFGGSRKFDKEKTSLTFTTFGTREYASTEIGHAIDNDKATCKYNTTSDGYSTGVLCFELMAGKKNQSNEYLEDDLRNRWGKRQEFLDFIIQLLKKDQSQRPDIDKILFHPYLKQGSQLLVGDFWGTMEQAKREASILDRELKHKCQHLEETAKALLKNIHDAGQSGRYLIRERQCFEDMAERTQHSLVEKVAEIKDVKDKNNRLEQDLYRAEGEIKETQLHHKKLVAEIKTCTVTWRNKEVDYQERILGLQIKVKDQQRQIEDHRSNEESQQKKIDDLTSRVQQLTVTASNSNIRREQNIFPTAISKMDDGTDKMSISSVSDVNSYHPGRGVKRSKQLKPGRPQKRPAFENALQLPHMEESDGISGQTRLQVEKGAQFRPISAHQDTGLERNVQAARRAPTPMQVATTRPSPIKSNQAIKHIIEKLFPGKARTWRRADVMDEIERVEGPKPRIFFLFRGRNHQFQGLYRGCSDGNFDRFYGQGPTKIFKEMIRHTYKYNTSKKDFVEIDQLSLGRSSASSCSNFFTLYE